jgi:molybdopterin-dependent oxidoreductase alpha subunit
MGKPRVKTGGGFAALLYSLTKGREAGGLLKLYRRLRSRNACKTCALGMGGQRGGMVDEGGHFPSVCKKSMQAQAGDMGRIIPESYFRHHSLDEMEKLTSAQAEKLGRLTFPIVAEEGDTHFRRIPWEEALDRAGDALRAAPPRETFFYASGRSSNEAAFLLQLIARAFGTPNIHNCSFYCHAASGVALSKVYGSGTASVLLDDLNKADLAIVIGANPASNHPRLLIPLMHMRRRGGRVITINPVKELGMTRFRIPADWRSMIAGTDVTDLYIQPHVGSDIALLKAMLKGVIERGGVDHGYVNSVTTGWETVREDVAAADWNDLLARCAVPKKAIDRAVGMLLRAKRGVFLWAMGLTHHEHGVSNILALANLALARGWLGRPGTGLLPIRGHSNVQGVGSVGVSPSVKEAFAKRMEEVYGIEVPRDLGQDTYASMVAAAEGNVQAAVLFGGNLWGSNPDLDFAGKALRNIPVTVSVTTKLNPGHIHGRGKTQIVIPVLARDEERETTTQESMFNFVRYSDGGETPIARDLRSEVEIVASIAERILPEDRFDWSDLRSHEKLRESMAKIVPGYGAIEGDREFQIEGRTFHEPEFATEDGRAHFHVTPHTGFEVGAGEFRLMTLRSEGQFNTVVYEEEDLYRGNPHRDVVMMNESDVALRGLAEGSRVRVITETGSMEVSVSVIDIPAGNLAMYYPEANAIVPRRLDPDSKTPAFKSVSARIERV